MRFLLSFFWDGLNWLVVKSNALVHRNNHIDMYTYINILQDNSLSVGRYNTHAVHQRWNKKIYITASLRCWSNYQKPSSINNRFTWTILRGKRSLLSISVHQRSLLELYTVRTHSERPSENFTGNQSRNKNSLPLLRYIS